VTVTVSKGVTLSWNYLINYIPNPDHNPRKAVGSDNPVLKPSVRMNVVSGLAF
jgi:hypothetical protein